MSIPKYSQKYNLLDNQEFIENNNMINENEQEDANVDDKNEIENEIILQDIENNSIQIVSEIQHIVNVHNRNLQLVRNPRNLPLLCIFLSQIINIILSILFIFFSIKVEFNSWFIVILSLSGYILMCSISYWYFIAKNIIVSNNIAIIVVSVSFLIVALFSFSFIPSSKIVDPSFLFIFISMILLLLTMDILYLVPLNYSNSNDKKFIKKIKKIFKKKL